VESRETILDFWFGREPDDATAARERAELWWSKDPATDREIRRRFEPLVTAAESGELEPWRAQPRGRLALILLTDQFPRNIYRDRPAAFRFDGLARALCLEGLEEGADRKLRPIERVFFYLPLEHSEDLEHQDRCVALFEQLADEVAPEQRATFANYHDYALRHRVVIERFGRFPHRNAILGRESTAEELEFLEQPGSSF
jgi:uncharacterized protein (DUF924 family)